MRDPGGIQCVMFSVTHLIRTYGTRPAPGASVFITLIVKAPIIQIFAMLLGMSMIALEYSAPGIKTLAIYRSFVVRIVLLIFQAFLCILYYQVSTS